MGGSSFRAVLWKDGVLTDLGPVNGASCCSDGLGINNKGQVVGSTVPDAHIHGPAFLAESGSSLDLNALVPPDSPLFLTEADFIDDRGEIIGLGLTPNGDLHGFLLIPVCENGTRGCADAPLDPTVVAQNKALLGAESKTMTTEELAAFKEKVARMHARMAGRNRGFGLWTPNK